MSENLKITCFVAENESSSTNSPKLNKNEYGAQEAIVGSSERIGFEIQPTFEDTAVINKILRNILRIKECCSILGEHVARLSIPKLEREKDFKDEATNRTDNLDTPTNIGTDTQKCVNVQEKILEDASKGDFNVEVKKSQNNLAKNDTFVTKRKKRKRDKKKRRKSPYGNSNITEHCPNESQIKSLREQAYKNEGESADKSFVQSKNKSKKYETIESCFTKRNELRKEFIQIINYLLLMVRKRCISIEECFKHDSWPFALDPSASDDEINCFDDEINSFDETDFKCDTKFVSSNSSTVTENQCEAENKRCFEDSLKIPIANPDKIFIDGGSKKLLNDDNTYRILTEEKTNPIKGDFVFLTKEENPTDNEFSKEPEATVEIHSITCKSIARSLYNVSSNKNRCKNSDDIIYDAEQGNQYEEPLIINSYHVEPDSLAKTSRKIHSNINNEYTPKITEIVHPSTQKENLSEDIVQIYSDVGTITGAKEEPKAHSDDVNCQDKQIGSTREFSYDYFDAEHESQAEKRISSDYLSHVSQYKVSKKHINDVKQENQSVTGKITHDNVDYENLTESCASYHFSRAEEILTEYDNQYSLINSLGGIPDIEDSDLSIDFKSFYNAVKEACLQIQKIIHQLFGTAEVNSKIWFPEEGTNKRNQYDIKQNHVYQKTLEEVRYCYKQLEESYQCSNAEIENLLIMIATVEEPKFQSTLQIILDSISLYHFYSDYLDTFEVLTENYARYRFFVEEMKDLGFPLK